MEGRSEAQHSNVSIMQMTKEDLQNKYSVLSELCSQLQSELEDKSQQIHDCKRELSRAGALEAEYLNEIESLQSEERNECDKLKQKIQNLEEEKNDINNVYTEHIEEMEQNIFEKDERIGKLQEELEAFSGVRVSTSEKNEVNELQLKNLELSNQIYELTRETNMLKEQLDVFAKQQLMQREQNNDLQEELTALNENYKCKKNELDEARALIETLQEDLMLTKIDLDTVRNKPLQDGSQGNSLFAEVDTKRVELQDKMGLMKSQNLQMRQERGKLLLQIAALNSQNAMLCQRWETENQDKLDDNDELEESYRARIDSLESHLEICLKQLSVRQTIAATTFDSNEIKFVENMLERKNKEISEIHKQVNSSSLSRMLITRQLRDSKIEMRNWRAKASKFESELGMLQAQIEDLKLKKGENETNSSNINYCTACMKNKKSSIQSSIVRPKLRDILGTLTRNSQTLSEDRFSRIDYSRQLKRSLQREGDPDSRNAEAASEAKENIKTSVQLEVANNIPKKVQFTEETINNSKNNTGKLQRTGKVIHCKPMILKKRC